MHVKISAISFSLSPRPKTKGEWLEPVKAHIQESLDQSSDIIVFPELFLLGLCEYYAGDFDQQLHALAADLKTQILPELTRPLMGRDVLLCLGSGPREVSGALHNTAFIYLNDKWIYQDKIHLTPWETHFTAGDQLTLFPFRGLTVSVLICFDIEQPSLAVRLKEEGVDLILVPSATADRNGNQRVNRCASARSIELGAAVLTVPLIGHSSCELVDFSEGRQCLFLPAQAAVEVSQEQESSYETTQSVRAFYQLDLAMMKAVKTRDEETKPYFKDERRVAIDRLSPL